MSVEILNFGKLSLNNNYEIKTIDELFLHIVSNQNPNITFEEIIDIIIEFYYTKASAECIQQHLTLFTHNINESVINNIYSSIMYNDYESIEEYNLNAIILFITNTHGTEYLYNIYINI